MTFRKSAILVHVTEEHAHSTLLASVKLHVKYNFTDQVFNAFHLQSHFLNVLFAYGTKLTHVREISLYTKEKVS